MTLVIDASAAVQASLPSDGFTLLAGEDVIAPALLWSEVPSVLHEMAWRGTVSREFGRDALERFLGSAIKARRHARLTPEAWRIADELGWAKTYDAESVALARLLGSRLLTLDAPTPASGVAPRRGSRAERALTPDQRPRRAATAKARK